MQDMQTANPLSDEEKRDLNIIYPRMPDSELLNTFRDLRNKLLRMSNDENFVCVVSALDETGDAALLSLNLAAVFAFDRYRSAIVVDCDTNVSILDQLGSRTDDVGLIDFIEADQSDLSVLIHDSGIDRIRVIPSGFASETRTESLESLRMKEIVLELKSRYADRYIFINAPSMKLSSEVEILSRVADMVVYQVQANTVSSSQVVEAIEIVGADKVAGIVFKERA